MSNNTVKLLATLILLSTSVAPVLAQETIGNAPQDKVSIVKLFPPVYPSVAKQTRITGDVQVALLVRPDGSLESATFVSGHPLLKQAALDSAQHSQFVCKDCGKELRSFQMTYSFQLGPTVYCTESSAPAQVSEKGESYSRVVQSTNHITLYDQPIGTCDLAFQVTEKRVRSIKCLFLWKCGLAEWHEEQLKCAPPLTPKSR